MNRDHQIKGRATATGRLPAGAMLMCIAICASQVCASQVCASPARAAPVEKNARCIDIQPSRTSRVGSHWLLVQLERIRVAPPTDYRVEALQARLLDERTGKLQLITIPVASLGKQLTKAVLRDTLVRVNRKGNRSDTFFVDLHHVSDDGKVVALEVRSRDKQRGSQRSIVLLDLATKRMTVGAPLVKLAPRLRETAVHAGTDATGGHLYVLNRKTRLAGDKVTATVRVVRVDAKTGASRTLIAFTTAPRSNRGLSVGGHNALSRDRSLLAIAEYLESPKGDAKVHVVNLKTGKRVSLPAPATAYGVAISPDNQRLVVGSSRLATVVVWDLKTKKQLRRAKGLKRLHKAFYSADGKTVWLAMKGGPLVGLDAKTLKRKKTVKRKALFRTKAAGAFYAELDVRPAGLPQTFAMVADKYGFGEQVRLCTWAL